MKKNTYFVLVLMFIVNIREINAQNYHVQNLQKSDKRKFHPGFYVGLTYSSFFIEREPNFSFTDSLVSIDPVGLPAFILGPIFSLNFSANVRLRTGIDLSFQDRAINYTFIVNNDLALFEKRVYSVYTGVPLILKLRTDRLDNYLLYVTGGASYGYNWQSKQKARESYTFRDIVKISRYNVVACVGGGIDIFLQFFKLGFDIKYNMGLNNVLIKNGTPYALPIKQIKTQMWQASVTFEY